MAIKNSRRYAELERMMSDYFALHLAPVMSSVRNTLIDMQADEMRDYSNSAAGMISMMATANMPGGDPYATLKITGKWNSKTTEDYIAMCKKNILSDKTLQKDLALMAEEWRSAVVKEIGRPRYDALSKQLGIDLAYAYVDHRVEQLMIDKVVRDKMPRSSAEYIMKKAAQTSLFGLAYELNKSPLTAEIEAKGEAAYKPSKIEKAAGWAAGATVDAVAMGGAGSWGTFAKFVGIDVVMTAGMDSLAKGNNKSVSVEQCISKAVFGSNSNVFTAFRAEGQKLKKSESEYIINTNSKLNKKIPTEDLPLMDWIEIEKNKPTWKPKYFPSSQAESKQREGKYKDVPMMIAPGEEDKYLTDKAKADKAKAAQATYSSQSVAEQTDAIRPEQQSQSSPQQTVQSNTSGWDGLLQSFGLNGITDIGKNLGYVLAMLPDVLVGLFTGKTKSIGMDNSIMPIASIMAGMFIKNPILKMLLIGIGGANLINKAGHEVLERKQNESVVGKVASARANYRQYADEPLNPRISNPVLQGHCLIANIDNVPCTIQLTDTIIAAHQAGALPLNTLANAILERNDQMRQVASEQYEAQSRENITRTRGIQ